MTTIKLKNGSGAPLATDLVQGEVALDLTNKRIYSENASGTVIEMGTSPSTIDINAGTIDGTVIGGASAAAGTFTTLNATGGGALTGTWTNLGTVSTVDINGGTIDGTTIGGSTAAAGTFTTVTGTSFVSSGDMTFGDNDKAIFGAGSDLQIYHDGSNSYINDAGTGRLFLTTNGTEIAISSTTDAMIKAKVDDAVELYYDNALKLATTSTGIDVTGTVTADGLTVDGNVVFNTDNVNISDNIPKLVFTDTDTATIASITGNSSNLVYDTASSAREHTFSQAGTTRMEISSTGIDVTGTITADGLTITTATSSSATLENTGDSGTTFNFDANRSNMNGWLGSNSYKWDGTLVAQISGATGSDTVNKDDGSLFFYTAEAGTILTRQKIDSNGDISFYEDTGTTPKLFWDASAESLGIGTSSNRNSTKLDVLGDVTFGANASYYGTLAYDAGTGFLDMTSSDGGFRWVARSGPTERMRIDSSGNLLVGQTSLSQTTVGFSVTPAGIVSAAMAASTSASNCYHLYSTGAAAYRFYVGLDGTVNATSATISAISDQRFKENIRDLDDGLDVVMALKPRKFDWKEGKGKNVKGDRGFIAQEFEQVLPDMIEEWKDPAPEGEEPYKAVNANLIPTLVKAIQEQQAIIESLKSRLDAAGL